MTTSPFRCAAAVALVATLGPTMALAVPLAAGGRGIYIPPVMRTAPTGVVPAHDHPGGWGGGWNRGWGGGWRGHHDDGFSDVLAGVLVLGGIAAVAIAASNADKHARKPARDYPDNPPPRYGDQQAPQPSERGGAPTNSAGPGSIDAAVDSCVDSVERGEAPVDSVDSVNNAGDGWHVEGHLQGGKPFACDVARGGQIRSLSVDGRALQR